MMNESKQDNQMGSLTDILSSTAKTSLLYTLIKTAVPLVLLILKADITPAACMQALFNRSNINSLMFVVFLTLPVKLVNYSMSEHNQSVSFLAGFASALLAYKVEKKTKLVEFVISSVCSRSLFAVINVLLVKNTASEGKKRALTLTVFITLCSAIIFVGFLHKSCSEIKNLVDSSAYSDIWELRQVNSIRRIINIL